MGIAASRSVISAAIGFLLFGLFMAKRLYASGEFTISGFIARKYGNGAKLVVSAIMIYALLLVNVGNYVSGAAAISTVMHVDLTTAALITAAISTIYFARGGLQERGLPDHLHSAVKVLGISITVAVALRLTGGLAPMVRTMPSITSRHGALSGGTIGAWIIGSAGAIFSPSSSSGPFPPPRARRRRAGPSLMAAVLCVPISIALGFIGVAAKYLYPEIRACTRCRSSCSTCTAGRRGHHLAGGLDLRQRLHRGPAIASLIVRTSTCRATAHA